MGLSDGLSTLLDWGTRLSKVLDSVLGAALDPELESTNNGVRFLVLRSVDTHLYTNFPPIIYIFFKTKKKKKKKRGFCSCTTLLFLLLAELSCSFSVFAGPKVR